MSNGGENEHLAAPASSMGDKLHALVRSGLGAIPVAGQAAIELFSALVAPPLEKRRDEWMRSVGELLVSLVQNRGVNLDDLQRDDAFVDLLMDASQAALRTSSDEKRKALRNAIQNAAERQAQGEDQALRHMFVRWVDELTVWHLRMLKLFQNPREWAARNNHQFPSWTMGGLSNVLESAYPQLSGRRDFYDQVWKDLYQRGLVNTEGLHTTMTESGLYSSRVSSIGGKFLNFIETDA